MSKQIQNGVLLGFRVSKGTRVRVQIAAAVDNKSMATFCSEAIEVALNKIEKRIGGTIPESWGQFLTKVESRLPQKNPRKAVLYLETSYHKGKAMKRLGYDYKRKMAVVSEIAMRKGISARLVGDIEKYLRYVSEAQGYLELLQLVSRPKFQRIQQDEPDAESISFR